MIKIISLSLIFNSFLLTLCLNPLSINLILIIQTILIATSARLISSSNWMPLTIFLVMIGGVMILFLYITSITSNKKIFLNFSPKHFFYYFFISIFFWKMNINIHFSETIQIKDLFNFEYIKLFLPLNSFSSIFMFLYLLFMLIIMIELLSSNKGPLRKKY